MLSLTSPVETPYHRLRPGVKLAALALGTLALFSAEGLAVQAGALAGVAALYLLGGWRFAREGARMLKPVRIFVAVVLLWHLATESLAQGLEISLRMVAAVALANLVTMTTRLDALLALVERLAAPLARLGLPVRVLSTAIAMFLRFLPVLIEKGAALREAWSARSRRRPGWRLVAPLALLAIDDAERVAEALRARGGLVEQRNRKD